ncbi:MAG: mandelate racemase [Planctomycetes bacterium]|nr:mandelate racemase [Planctomycetota bacterium]
MPVGVRVRGFHVGLTDCRLRIPFRFGVATLTAAPHATVSVEIEDEQGERSVGFAGDLLAPKWFDKDLGKSNEQNFDDLITATERAMAAFAEPAAGCVSVFEHWRRVYGACHVSGRDDPSAALVSGFGVALCERAIIDAACRMVGLSFVAALREDLLGFRPGVVWPELAGWDHAADLGAPPKETMVVRHTVGMADALQSSDVSAGDRLNDGLPECLVEDIRRYGLNTFKLKLCGDKDEDLERLLAFSAVVGEHVPDGLCVTVDANEQFAAIADVVRLLEELSRRDGGQRLLDALVLIEQPLARHVTFDADRTAGMADLEAFAPCIIDEADVDIDAFDRALECGYRGVSVKNCKGVFRALLNRGLVCARAEGPGDLFQSGEDLTNLAVLSLQQDLVTHSVLGLPHVERNGHHYFRGLEHLPETEVRQALSRHPDLYEARDGLAQVRIVDGVMELGSLHGPGYGHAVDVDMEARAPLAAWRSRG